MSDSFEEMPFPEYLSGLAKELSPIYKFIGEIAPGKNGQTYKLETRSAHHYYCLKTISPSVTENAERERVRETLKKEVSILKALSHRCLPKVYEHNLDEGLPYYVCTFHPGATWEKFRKSDRRLKLEEAVFVVVSLIDALEYLHTNGRTHCDLHQDNILLSEKVFAEGLMIIDFGSGHRESASPELTPDRGHWAFKDVKGQGRFQQPVKRKIATDDFRANDIRAFGRALAVMERCFFSTASHDQLLCYREFCRLLQEGAFDTWHQVREQFEHVIDPNAFMTKTERFFVEKDGTRPAIPLPAADPIPVGEAILAVINTQVYQRLRTIKQLSFCEWYFPGGTHSRFEHSLGVFGVARHALSFLSRDSNFKARFTQSNVNGALLAALVHDLGHYPFAHVIEHYVAGRYSSDKSIREAIHHFNHTLSLLDSDEELRTAIGRHWGEDLTEETKRILLMKIPPLSELLDGPVDCDKLDYLRRDAHHCGVPYGTGLDTLGVLQSFRCSQSGEHLLVDSKKVPAVEGFMIVQDQMLGSVYWHETIRAVFAMFHRFLDGTVGNDAKALIELVRKLKACSSEYEALYQVIIPLLNSQPSGGSSTRGSKDELDPLIRLHRIPNFNDIYRPIAKYSSIDAVAPKRSSFNNVFDTIVRSPSSEATSVPIVWERVKRLRISYRDAFAEKRANPGRFDILVDVPWGKASNRIVTVLDDDGRIERPITEVSHLAPTIFSTPTAYAAPIRIYVSPRLFTQFEDVLNSIRTSAEERYFGKGNLRDDDEIL